MSRSLALLSVPLLAAPLAAFQATVVPTDIEEPGTQPGEVTDLQPPTQCDNCHGGYEPLYEPAHNWRGSMMAHASRDPLFWATVAVAEQDFPGSGDLCLRCHVARGWLEGRSTPTDGSALAQSDATGVSCDLCHSMVNPDGGEHPGVQNPPYVANDGGSPAVAYSGSGMFVLQEGDNKLGPYDDAQVNHHPSTQSLFHRSAALCATCHDVSNPAVGDLAPWNGHQLPLPDGTHSGVPGDAVELKAAFNNLPFRYGTVERTSSEHAISALADLAVAAWETLPPELQQGAIEDAALAALASTSDGNYVDGAPRTFTCQTCHMPPVEGEGAKQSFAPTRADLPLHDLTGGNYWVPEAMAWLDAQGDLVLGGNLSSDDAVGMAAGALRARHNLTRAAALEVQGDTLEVINLTGHKLMTGFPEGRRAWLHVRWLDAGGGLLREDGAYGPLDVVHEGAPLVVETLLDPHGAHARVYEVHYGMTQEWAAELLAWGWPAGLALSYDRQDGAVEHTLGELAAQPPGTRWHTLHFVLNDTTVSDTRVPPVGMSYDLALARGILPVPTDQYGDPGPGGTFAHQDVVPLDPPAGAASATIELMYQPTSWEYVQFLALSNGGGSALLADAGEHLLEAWLATGMAAPQVMASAAWTAGEVPAGYCFCLAGPCGNDDPLAGCANSTGAGATLASGGSPSVGADDLAFLATNLLPAQPALLFVGEEALNGGAGIAFGDGLRCAGSNVVRLGVETPDAGGLASWGPGLGAAIGWSPGDVRRFQVWYRDPLGGPCLSGFNLTNGVERVATP